MKVTGKSIDILYRFVRYLYIKESFINIFYVVGLLLGSLTLKLFKKKFLIFILIFRFCYTADDNPHFNLQGSNVPCEDSH